MEIHTFDVLGSTNQYCKLLDLKQTEEFTIIWALSQPEGIGQRGNRWESEAKKNLTFSVILHPIFLPPQQQYLLTKVLALGISDYLIALLPNESIHIKWPNDIYVGKRKVCGILVENHIGQKFESAVCGIGFNVNQSSFSDWIPNPISLSQITGMEYDLQTVLEALVTAISERYNQLRDGLLDRIDKEYLSRLLYLNERHSYRYLGETIQATITGVNTFGHLLLHTDDEKIIVAQMKEIELLLAGD